MWINRQIDHPNVVRFIEAQEDKDFLYLVFEFMEGGEVSQWKMFKYIL